MSEFIAFVLGIFVGVVLGVIIMAIVVGAKNSREEWEIEAAIERIEKGNRGDGE